MFTALQARNFKSWKDTRSVALAPLTALFGTNSSGKTSILQMLLLLKQTAESPDRKRVLHTGDERSLVDLGTFFDLVHGHASDAVVGFRVAWDLAQPLSISDPSHESQELFRVNDLEFSTDIREEFNRPSVDSFQFTFGANVFGMRRRQANEQKERVEYDLIHSGYTAIRTQGRPWPLPAPVKCYGFPDEATSYYQNVGFLPDFVLAFEKAMAGIAYLGPLRQYPSRSYLWAGSKPVDVGRQGEEAVSALLAARVEHLESGRGVGKGRRYKTIEQRIAEWLQAMGLIHSFQLRPLAPNRKDFELRVRKSRESAEVLITDVGFGVSQVLPVLTLLYYVPEGSTVLLEQPEIHLHPAVQSLLADVLVDVVKERRVQVIVESHSEHLLRRLQRHIAEGEFDSAKTALYFCSMNNGASQLERLQIDLHGRIANWPKGFFVDEMDDYAAMARAVSKGTA